MKDKYTKYIVMGVGATIFFIIAAQLSQTYSTDLQNIVLNAGIFAPLFYIFINIVSIAIAPLSSGFAVPLAANAFGPILTAIYSIIGWLVGSIIAFYLARRYGYGEIKESKICKKIESIERDMSQKKRYLLIILLRMSLPADVLSYALGLFSTISYSTFIGTTLIGITPFAFLFSYASVSSLWYQVGISVLCGASFLTAMHFLISYKSGNIQQND